MRKIILVVASLGLLAGAVQAQQPQPTPPTGSNLTLITSRVLGKSDCNSTAYVSTLLPNQVGVSAPTILTDTSSMVFLRTRTDSLTTGGVCSTSTPAGIDPNDKLTSVKFTGTTGHIDFLIKDLLPQNACTNPVSTPVNAYSILCLYSNGALISQVSFKFDTSPNTVSISAAAGDEQATIVINDPKALGRYQICAGKAAAKDAFEKDTACASPYVILGAVFREKEFTITGLENGQTYLLKARVSDDAGASQGDWSASVPVTPVEAYSFTDLYDGTPNATQFNCRQSSSPSAFGLWLFAGLILWGLRRLKIASPASKLALFGILLFAASPSMADLGQVSLAITGAPYLPNIDTGKTATGTNVFSVYRCLFGKPGAADGPLLPLMGLDVDVHMTDAFGSLQLGVGATYTFVTDKAVNDKACTQKTTNNVSAHFFQLKPQVTYVLDRWIDSFPLAPYIRGAIVGQGYVFTFQDKLDQPGSNPSAPGTRGSGVVFGWEAAFGLMFLLDVLEPNVASSARGEGTYDHTYLKAEIAYMPINNFNGGGMNLSSGWLSKDVPLMLTFGLVLEFQ